MGAIYKVRHRLLDEIRVVKVLKPQVLADEEMRLRFVEEARTATRLKHPNICTIHDFALDADGTAYLVMEFIDGVNLADLLRAQGSPGLPLSLEITHQSLLALGYLHRRNVVHRDVAPDNLMLTHDEESKPLVKLIDLGIAKELDQSGNLTATGTFLGKLKYASPEQFGALPPGEKIDGRSDLYCLGLVLYELVTGSRPFVGETPPEMLRAHLFAPPIPFSQTDPAGKVPAELRAAILRALEKKREDRYASAEDFDRDIASLRHRFTDPKDLDDTGAILSKVRATPISPSAGVTPSAQDRLDRQFGAQTTPSPTKQFLSVVPAETARLEGAPTVASPLPAAGAPPPRRRFPAAMWVGGIAAALGAIALAMVLLRPSASARREATNQSPTGLPTPRPAQLAQANPTATSPPPELEPTSFPPTEVSAAEPAPSPAQASPRAKEDARKTAARAADARRSAERARSSEQAPALYELGRGKQKQGEQLLSRGQYGGAQAAFEAAVAAFGEAEGWARARPERRPATPVEKMAALREPTPRSEPPRVAPPTAAAPSPAGPTRPASSLTEPIRGGIELEKERIRETVRSYVEALNALDSNLYARVYPSVDRERMRANFQSLHSQTLEFDLQKIEIAAGGTSAVVRGYEKRTAVPHVGSEQRVRGDRVIHLEKRGDSWVIVSLS